MSLINRSYAVLSDPEQRRAHDEWIAAQDAVEKPVSSPMPKSRDPEHGLLVQTLYARRLWLGLLFFAALIGVLFWLAGQQREAAVDMPVARADTAPAGYPEFAQYMAGYPVLGETGNGMVKIDNQANRSAVLVQIYPENGDTALRTIYIPPHADFTAFKLPPGSYRIRYRRLADDSRENTAFTLSDGQTQAAVVQLESARTGLP